LTPHSHFLEDESINLSVPIREQQSNGDLASKSEGVNQHYTLEKKTLTDIGISRDQSSKFQKLARDL
jgi:uncharacterized protein YjiS (DUF1127 family)